MKEVLNCKEAPQAIGPYSQGIGVDGFLFLSGQIALSASGEVLTDKSVSDQTDLIMQNIKNLLESAGMGLENIVKTTIYLTDIADFEEVNTVYAKYFINLPPARSTLAVLALPKNAKVEIECIAYKK